ncbi:hypothetical protein [Herbaspirillum frisingense]
MSQHDDDIAGSQPASEDSLTTSPHPGRRRFLGGMAGLPLG